MHVWSIPSIIFQYTTLTSHFINTLLFWFFSQRDTSFSSKPRIIYSFLFFLSMQMKWKGIQVWKSWPNHLYMKSLLKLEVKSGVPHKEYQVRRLTCIIPKRKVLILLKHWIMKRIWTILNCRLRPVCFSLNEQYI